MATNLVSEAVEVLSPIVSRIASGLGLNQSSTRAGGADVVPRSLEVLRQVSATLDAKAPADAPAFKAWLNSVAQKVAEASKEGGFLGFGGVPVSEAEKATLEQIASALGTRQA